MHECRQEVTKSYADSWAQSNTTETSGHNEAKCWLHYPIWLVSVVKKVPWHWEKTHQQAFGNIKATTTKDVTLVYPEFTQGFEVNTDSLSLQVGAVITQANRPLAFFSRKLFPAQQKYSMTEQELLAIVETLREFKGMLWGSTTHGLYTSQKSNAGCFRFDI